MTTRRPRRCPWCEGNELYVAYHDAEWGVPLHDDQRLFEMLILEGAQAGLSWITILKKRPAYRRAFHDFDMTRIARYNTSSVNRLLNDVGIVRNRLKIEAAIDNARAALAVVETHGSLDRYLWQFVDGQPVQNRYQHLSDVPAKTAISDHMSRELKQRGFRFVGSTICYAFMQAVGMVNDHLTGCFRHRQIRALSS